ncbi:MAG: hypothetical protein O9353_03015, partial [Bacteroidia bacterium]|nr:hypothetical protein [Bacteroidia bacterium]
MIELLLYNLNVLNTEHDWTQKLENAGGYFSQACLKKTAAASAWPFIRPRTLLRGALNQPLG